MCGIVAVWGEDGSGLARSMMTVLAHRGPDADGMLSSGGATLGHRRLSIMDPNGGDQPIRTEDGAAAIVANGEIYNYRMLAEGLANQHHFRTTSDSEVPLHLFQDLGNEVANRLDGMFAFIITDGKALFAARDPVGIKPLYYGRRGEQTVFASELKALTGIVSDVREFPPGAFYHSDVGFRTYRPLPTAEPNGLQLEECSKRVRTVLEDAVIKRLMSDVPLGTFLSGGLDSSVIAAIARPHVDKMHTFSVGLEGSRDLEAARLVARHLDTVHHEYVFTQEEIARELPEIIYYLESYDQDLVRSAVPCYFVSRLASQYVKVVLSGEGADELFGGYAYHKDIENETLLHKELQRSVSSLHNINLQRVDRMTMAHSLEARVPFLDLEMIELAQTVPARWKIFRDASGRRVEKWILRKAVEDLLPAEIVWRVKEQFDEGSGSADALATIGSRFMDSAEAQEYMVHHRSARLRSREESVYHKLLRDAYEDPTGVVNNVARWTDRPVGPHEDRSPLSKSRR